MPDGSAQNIATGLAGGLIVIALLETLLDKNVIASCAALTNSSKAQREVCAAGRAVLDADGRGMGIGDALDDRKSQPRISRPSPVAPPEALKNQLALILFDARTLIENPHHTVALDDDLHGRSRRRIVDGVLDQITDRS